MSDVTQRVFAFGCDHDGNNVTEGGAADLAQLGYKGANLAEMANLGLPVPPGFTVGCRTCADYLAAGKVWPKGALDVIMAQCRRLEERTGRAFGSNENPLLVSVRCSSPVQVPGLLETVLDLGLNDETVEGLAKRTGDVRFALDSYRRFIQMFSELVIGLDRDLFENVTLLMKRLRGERFASDLSPEDLAILVEEFKAIFCENVSGYDYPELVLDGRVQFPQDPMVQLQLALEAMFASWENPQAAMARRHADVSDGLGLAVCVQAMVFGNKGASSATGVAFTRNPATGKRDLYGSYLPNAQGEDVIKHAEKTLPLSQLLETPGLREAGLRLRDVFCALEGHYRDMCDIEFTIEDGRLWMLQTRIGRRTAAAAVSIAIQLVEEGLISKEEAILRVDAEATDQLLHPQFAPEALFDVLASGLNASPGAAVGQCVFSAEAAVESQRMGVPCILVRWETTPDDYAGMTAAEGILTSHGGKTSHAAVVARGIDTPCVCGAADLMIDAEARQARVAGTDVVLGEGDVISIDGTRGIVVLGAVELAQPKLEGELKTMLEWADEFRTLGVHANADTPADAAVARNFGAQGVGLCRTEHLFLGERKQLLQSFILNDDSGLREKFLAKMAQFQTNDFYEMLKSMDGLPVVIRLLDPPLHEFLDDPRALAVEVATLEAQEAPRKLIAERRSLLEKIDSFSERNPMLGLRGVRLAITYPELPQMQVRAIAQAAARLKQEGFDPQPRIMVPLVALMPELAKVRALALQAVAQVAGEEGVELDIPVGTMIELPRAAVTADEIATQADFFSFGTNDLTQASFGFSRDDVEGEFVPQYLADGILAHNPFATVDPGVVRLVRLGVEYGRSSNPSLRCGVCGEHGGDPASIKEFSRIGMDYVSCSPYRVPLARLAAAQAALSQ